MHAKLSVLEGSLEKDESPVLMGLGMGNMQCSRELPAQPGLKLKGRQLSDYRLMKDNLNG